jgi:HSP20 family protein
MQMFGTLTNFEGSLFDDLWRLQREMDEAVTRWPWPAGIRSAARGTYPPLNVGVTPEKVDVYLFVAGLDPKGLDLSIQQNLLTISGERNVPERENVQYYREERFDGAFRRVVTLPEDVDPEKVEANYVDGVLHVSVQRREATKPRQIEIK